MINKNYIVFINYKHNMPYKDKAKCNQYHREWYSANKKKISVRQQLLNENETLKLEVERLRKALVFYKCIECGKVND